MLWSSVWARWGAPRSASSRSGAVRAVGIERFEPGHDRGSSHGLTRIIRLGYFEHPSYVPLVRRAYALWRELEAASGQKLLTVTGIAEMGPPDGVLVARHARLLAPARLCRMRCWTRARADAALSAIPPARPISSA